jgi:site-specific DNA-methyltransferase (adenine-specific)
MFSSVSNEWETPQDLYNELDNEFHFTLDPASQEYNHKCKNYYTYKENGLLQNWQGETVFCNPPYGKESGKWVKKCYEESLKPNTTVVMLIPSRTDTRWFHNYIFNKAEIRF